MLVPLAGGIGTVVKLGELMMILELHRQGLTVSAIARQLGMDRKTVRRYVARGLEPPAYGPRPRQQRSTDPFLSYLRERLAAYPGLTAVRLWRELRERGYAGGYTAVKRTVRDIRPEPVKPFEVRFETPPGAQAQVDLAHFEVVFADEPGATRIVWLFSLVLGFSRLIWARFVVHQDLQTVLRCHIFDRRSSRNHTGFPGGISTLSSRACNCSSKPSSDIGGPSAGNSAGVSGVFCPPLFLALHIALRRRRQLQHSRPLAGVETRQQRNPTIRKFQAVVVLVGIILVDLTEDSNVVERLQTEVRMQPRRLIERDLSAGEQANSETTASTKTNRAGAEVLRLEPITDLRRPRSNMDRVVAHRQNSPAAETRPSQPP